MTMGIKVWEKPAHITVWAMETILTRIFARKPLTARGFRIGAIINAGAKKATEDVWTSNNNDPR